MKKSTFRLLILTSVLVLSVTTAFAYGTTTFTENDIKYTCTDACSFGWQYIGVEPYGYLYENVYASCDISPTIYHYSTADIRKSRTSSVYATSGRVWKTAQTTNAHCQSSIPDSSYNGYGWWGH